jgi:hypothetical protein
MMFRGEIVLEEEMVIRVYEDILQGKRTRFPNHFFIGEQGKKYLVFITRYLIEIHLEISINEIPRKVKAEILWNYRLRPPAQICGWNFIDLIQQAYPGKFKPTDFTQVSYGYWQGQKGKTRAIETIKTLIEEELKIPLHEIPQIINHQFFEKSGLGGIFNVFNASPYEVINAVYPGQFKPWEFRHVPLNYWKNPENIKQVMDWFLFQKLHFESFETAIECIRVKHLYQHRLTGLFQIAFHSSLENVKKWIAKQYRNNT